MSSYPTGIVDQRCGEFKSLDVMQETGHLRGMERSIEIPDKGKMKLCKHIKEVLWWGKEKIC